MPKDYKKSMLNSYFKEEKSSMVSHLVYGT